MVVEIVRQAIRSKTYDLPHYSSLDDMKIVGYDVVPDSLQQYLGITIRRNYSKQKTDKSEVITFLSHLIISPKIILVISSPTSLCSISLYHVT